MPLLGTDRTDVIVHVVLLQIAEGTFTGADSETAQHASVTTAKAYTNAHGEFTISILSKIDFRSDVLGDTVKVIGHVTIGKGSTVVQSSHDRLLRVY